MKVEHWLELGLLAALAWCLAAAAVRTWHGGALRAHRAPVAAALAALLAAGVARAIGCRPSFIHANHHAAEIVDAILMFPEPVSGKPGSYGAVSFLVLAGATELFGRTFEVIAGANQLFSVATLGLMGWAAARWSGRPWAALPVIALGALHVPLGRVAASEDAHNLALLLAWTATVAVDVHARSGRRLPLAIAVLSSVLMLLTRQTLYLWAPCLLLLALARGGRDLLRRADFLIAAGLIAAVCLARVWATLHHPGDAGSTLALIPAIPRLIDSPGRIATLLGGHPLVDPRFAAVLLPLELAGVVWMVRHRRPGGALLAVLVMQAALTLMYGFPPPGVRFSFRAPVMTLGIVTAGLGATFLARWLAPRVAGLRWARPAAGLALVVLAATPVVLPGWGDLGAVSPQWVQYELVREAAPSLPRSFVLLERDRQSAPPRDLPLSALTAQGIEVRRVSEAELPHLRPAPGLPILFLEGVACRAWTLPEVMGWTRDEWRRRSRAADLGFDPFRYQLPAGTVVPSARPACARMTAGGAAVGPAGAIAHPAPEFPYLFFGDGPIPVRFVRLPPPP